MGSVQMGDSFWILDPLLSETLSKCLLDEFRGAFIISAEKVAVGLSESERKFMGTRQAVALIRSIREEHSQPIYLNADHTHSLRSAEEAARAGFDSIVFDRSELPLEQNVAETKRAVEALKTINPDIIVEGEIGYIGSGSEIRDQVPADLTLTTPEEARQFVHETRVDVLSPAVGNMHGPLKSMLAGQREKRLNIDLIREIKKAAGVFMTLHGGSGTNTRDLQLAIEAGITVVHVNTDIWVAWRRGSGRGLVQRLERDRSLQDSARRHRLHSQGRTRTAGTF
jgi:fructose-bisphosphate aldolase class II